MLEFSHSQQKNVFLVQHQCVPYLLCYCKTICQVLRQKRIACRVAVQSIWKETVLHSVELCMFGFNKCFKRSTTGPEITDNEKFILTG
jgi:hypothetical protein